MTGKKTIEKTKLIKLLSTFSTLEWKRFGRFVQSPYHNSNQQIVALYTYLKKVAPFDNEKLLEQDRIYRKIYGETLFKLNTFQSICSDLYRLACDFIIDVHFQEKKRKREKALIDALSQRNHELFKGTNKQLIKEVETQKYFLDGDDFLLLHQLYNELYHHLEYDKYSTNKIELEKAWEYLNSFYEDTKIQFQTEEGSAQNILTLKNEEHKSVRKRQQISNLFQEAYNLHEAKQMDLFFQLKNKVLENWDRLKEKHKRNLLIHLLNFTFTNELIQKEYGNKEALNLYKIGILNKLFIINGKMRDIEFINIAMIGFVYESEKWTVNFIETHKQFLSKDKRFFLIPLAYAYSAIYQKDFEKVIYLLRDINPKNNLIYNSIIKRLLIRAYFEGVINGHKEYLSLFNYEIDSLQKMTRRNIKLSNIKKEATINFVNLVKQLLFLFLQKPIELIQIKSFEHLLLETNPLILRTWLQDKLIELKNMLPP